MPLSRTEAGEKAAIDLYCQKLGDVVEVIPPRGLVPPDAIIKRKNGTVEWLEVTSVWRGEHALTHRKSDF